MLITDIDAFINSTINPTMSFFRLIVLVGPQKLDKDEADDDDDAL